MTENWRCAAVVSAPLSLVPIIRNVNIPASSGSREERKMAKGKALKSWVSILKLGWTLSVSQAVSDPRSEEHTSELPSLMRISYAVFCLKKKKHNSSDYCASRSPNHASQQ